MAKKFLVNLDLSKNQLLNAAIQNLSSAPSSPVAGQIYFNTADKAVYFWDGTTWVNVSGDITAVIAGNGLVGGGTSGSVTLDINVDNATIEIVSDTVRVKDLGITSAKINDGAVTTIKLAGNSVTLAKLQQIGTGKLLGRTSSGTGNVEEVTISQDVSIDSPAIIPSTAAVKAYVDTTVGQLGNLEGGWDVASNARFPDNPMSGGIQKGDYWYATTAGTITPFTGPVIKINIGDVMIAKVSNATPYGANDWIVLEVNRDQATEDTLGLVKIATQYDVNLGIDDTTAVTPLKLKTYLDNAVGGYATNVGNGSATSFALTHNLGTRDVIVSIYDNATYEEVIVDVVATSTSVVTVSFATAPAADAYRVVIKK